jgi:hypothetical protein
MAEQQDASIRPIDNSFRRRAIGAALGLALAMSPALALAGFWNWLFFVGVPVVRRGQESGAILSPAVCLAIVGLFGLALGVAIAWPDQRRGFVKASLMVCGLALVMFVVLSWNRLQIGLIELGTTALVAAALLLFRQVLEWTLLAFRHSRRSGYWALLAILVLLAIVSIGINWGWLQFPFSDDGVLLTVHRHAQAQGWRGYSLELGNRVSGIPDVRVRMADGLVLNCRLTFGFDNQAVMCKP